MAAFFLLPCFLRTPVWSRTRLLWAALVLALGTATFVFTWCPPDGLLFRDFEHQAVFLFFFHHHIVMCNMPHFFKYLSKYLEIFINSVVWGFYI